MLTPIKVTNVTQMLIIHVPQLESCIINVMVLNQKLPNESDMIIMNDGCNFLQFIHCNCNICHFIYILIMAYIVNDTIELERHGNYSYITE